MKKFKLKYWTESDNKNLRTEGCSTEFFSFEALKAELEILFHGANPIVNVEINYE